MWLSTYTGLSKHYEIFKYSKPSSRQNDTTKINTNLQDIKNCISNNRMIFTAYYFLVRKKNTKRTNYNIEKELYHEAKWSTKKTAYFF